VTVTGESIDHFTIGALVKVSNADLDINADVRVMSITKSDLTGAPGDISLELANKGEEFDFVDKVNVNDLSGIDINNIHGGTPGGLPSPTASAGLIVTTDYLGYWDGSNWKTYMDSAGKLWADNGTQWFRWDPTATPALVIKGAVTITGGSGIGNLTDAGDLAVLDVVGTAQITNLAVTNAKIGSLAVTEAKIHDLAVTAAKIANLTVTAAKITDLTVTNIKLAGSITYGKIQSISLDSVVTGSLTSDFVTINGDINFHPASAWHSIMGAAYMEGYHSGQDIHQLQLGSLATHSLKLLCGATQKGLTVTPAGNTTLSSHVGLVLDTGDGSVYFNGIGGSDFEINYATITTGGLNYAGGKLTVVLPGGYTRYIKLWTV